MVRVSCVRPIVNTGRPWDTKLFWVQNDHRFMNNSDVHRLPLPPGLLHKLTMALRHAVIE